METNVQMLLWECKEREGGGREKEGEGEGRGREKGGGGRREGEGEGEGREKGGGRKKGGRREGGGRGKKRGGKWKESFNLTDLTRVYVLDDEVPPSSPLGGHTVRVEENPGSCTSC